MRNTHRRSRSLLVTSLAISALLVLATGVVTVALGSESSAAVALAADSGPCGSTGALTSPTSCTYTNIGSDRFTVPDGVGSATVDVVGAQGGLRLMQKARWQSRLWGGVLGPL